jgi:predicted FMN-binding regulatory protein PaiB
LILSQDAGRLVTVTSGGHPRIGLYPFLYDGATVELHLVRGDRQVTDLRYNPRCLFEVDDVLAFVPSYFEDESDGTKADLYYQIVVLEGKATVVDDPSAVAGHLLNLLRRYQPEERYRSVTTDDPLYTEGIARLALVRIVVDNLLSKFKLGQQNPESARHRILEGLRSTGRPGDDRAAEVVARTLCPLSVDKAGD